MLTSDETERVKAPGTRGYCVAGGPSSQMATTIVGMTGPTAPGYSILTRGIVSEKPDERMDQICYACGLYSQISMW